MAREAIHISLNVNIRVIRISFLYFIIANSINDAFTEENII